MKPTWPLLGLKLADLGSLWGLKTKVFLRFLMLLRCSTISPSARPRSPKMVQDGIRMAPRWLQDALKRAPRRPQEGPKTAARWLQVASSRDLLPKTPCKTPKRAQRRPQEGPRTHQEAPRGPQEALKRLPKGLQNPIKIHQTQIHSNTRRYLW